MASGSLRRAGAVLLVLGTVGPMAIGPAWAGPAPAGGDTRGQLQLTASGDCNFPISENTKAKPWALQRVFLNEVWGTGKPQPNSSSSPGPAPSGKGKGKTDGDGPVPNRTGAGVVVAVIDTGVDNRNPQLKDKVIEGPDLLKETMAANNKQLPEGTSTTDLVGHGTKVAGIIAAALDPTGEIGFVGLAKDAKILAIRQNDADGNGDVVSLVKAIDAAIGQKVQVINISQDVRVQVDPNKSENENRFDHDKELGDALKRAEAAGIVVVASSGNDGTEGPTFPAAYPTVLSVGASDRNNERAPFSQYGDFVKVAAPGVDMLSTVPGHGQCTDNGTSFSAPYVSGVAALLKGWHPTWNPMQIRTVIEQTAQRTERGPNKYIGWGVVDPVKAMEYSEVPGPSASPSVDAQVKLDTVPLKPQPLGLEETQADRDRRTGTFVLGIGALMVAGLAGGSIVTRDMRRRRGRHD
ncbi:type VII secretion-associated serine protease mycosin [Kitasatospora cineracea]